MAPARDFIVVVFTNCRSADNSTALALDDVAGLLVSRYSGATASDPWLPSSKGTSAVKLLPVSVAFVRPTNTPSTAGPTVPLTTTLVPLVSVPLTGVSIVSVNGIDCAETNHWRTEG